MNEKHDVPSLVSVVIAILISVGIGMGVYSISTNLVADGQFFDTSMDGILDKVYQNILAELDM